MSTLHYTKDHEWIRVEGEIGTVGITSFAQQQLGDVVYVELPEVERKVIQGKDAAVVESVKAASEIYAPVDGTVSEINSRLNDEPSLVNDDPETSAWFFKIRIHDPQQLDRLMDQSAYDAFIKELA